MTVREKIRSLPLTDTQIAFFYLGQEGYLLKFRDQYILIDGYLTDFLDRTISSISCSAPTGTATTPTSPPSRASPP